MPEKSEDILAKILNLCESNPDAGLEFIEQTIRDKPESESDPFGKFAKAMAYGSKGLFQLSRRKPDVDFAGFDQEQLRDDLGVTDTHLDYLEKGLQEIRQMEELHPGALRLFGTEDERMGELKVDAMAMVLERCRPGRVQEILGKTKLIYFGPERVFSHNDCDITEREFRVFREIFFASEDIAKSALLRLDGEDKKGRRYVTVVLYKEPKVFNEWGEQSPVAGFVCLFNDATFSLGALPEEQTKKENGLERSESAAVKQCVKCHRSIPIDALFCTQCGAKQ
jgi:hypothetical protein